MSRFQVAAIAVLCAAVGAVVAVVVGGGKSGHTTTTVVQGSGTSSSGSSLPTSFASAGKALSINQIYRMDSPGVVDIDVISKGSSSTTSLFGGGSQQEEEGEGAGVVYDKSGDILTDEHVVSGAIKVTVHFQDGLSAPAKVLGTDPSTDVGVIKVNVDAKELHPLKFGDSASAQVGDPVVAIGSPFSLPETTTQGIVSATGRPIQAPNKYTITGAIQTDAAINPGNSGGPLIDAEGKVLGLNDQIETANTSSATGEGSSSGIGFATPGNEVLKIAKSIINGTPVQHSYLGVSLNPDSANGAQIAQNGGQSTTSGQACSSVTPGSPAAKAGLQPGDTITAVDGTAVTSTDQLISTLDGYNPGQTITLTIKRNGQPQQLKVTLGNRPATTCAG